VAHSADWLAVTFLVVKLQDRCEDASSHAASHPSPPDQPHQTLYSCGGYVPNLSSECCLCDLLCGACILSKPTLFNLTTSNVVAIEPCVKCS